jgi:serine/threonine protein kinase
VSDSEVRAQAQLVARRYRLVRELGRGGMSTVWLAADELLGRMVAIKELRPGSGLTDEDVQTHQRRALQEARSAARIQHPNAVTLYEVIPAIAATDPVYLVMEFVEGQTLGALIERDGPLPAWRVAGYGLQVLDALAAAHALGIVHRDVKPENIMITPEGHAKLSDFGIAHTVGDPRLTKVGFVMGTQAYIAPELFNAAPITPAADLWSLGATLYHAAAGQGPFNRDSSGATLRAILFDEVPVPRCDPILAAAITGLLRRDPRERVTIDEARASLRQVAGGRPASEPASGLVRAGPAAGLQPGADTGQVAGGWPVSESASPLPLPDPAADLQPGWDASTRLHSPAGLQIPPPRQTLTRKHQRRGLPGSHRVAIAAAAVLLLAGGVVGGILATRSPSAGDGQTSPKHPAPTVRARHSTAATPSPDSLTTPPAPTVFSSGILTLQTTITVPTDAGQHHIAYSPDSAMLVTYGSGSGSDAMLWNATTGALIASLPFGTGVTDAAFSPNSQTVAVAEHNGTVALWNIADHNVTYTLTDTSIATGVAFSPDGNTLAVADGSGIRLLDLATRRGITLTVPGQAAGLQTVMFTPSGLTLAAASITTGYVYLWHVSTGALIGAIAPPANDPAGLGTWISYSNTTGLLAIGSSGAGNTFPGVRFCSVQSAQVVSTLEYPGVDGVNGVAYDPVDGSALAVVGNNGKIYVWEMPEGKVLADPVDPGAAGIADVAFSPDGKTLAVIDKAGHIFLWSVAGTG